jgi:hypothetical protein
VYCAAIIHEGRDFRRETDGRTLQKTPGQTDRPGIEPIPYLRLSRDGNEVRRDCAILEPQSASVTINTVISLVKKVTIIPFNENQYAARLIIPASTLRLLSAAHLPLKKEREACHFIAPG